MAQEMISSEYQETYDQLETIKTFCQIGQLLIRTKNYDWLASVIEAVQLDIQSLLERHCQPEVPDVVV